MKAVLLPVETHDVMPSVLETALLLGRRFGSLLEGFALRPVMTEFVPVDMRKATNRGEDLPRKRVKRENDSEDDSSAKDHPLPTEPPARSADDEAMDALLGRTPSEAKPAAQEASEEESSQSSKGSSPRVESGEIPAVGAVAEAAKELGGLKEGHSSGDEGRNDSGYEV